MIRILNSLMWIALGIMLLAIDIVSSISLTHTKTVLMDEPESIEHGVAIYEGSEHVWYEVTKIDNIMGLVFIIGGLIGIGAILYEKHSNQHIR